MLSVQNGRWECNEALALESATYFLYLLKILFLVIILIYFQQFFSFISFSLRMQKKQKEMWQFLRTVHNKKQVWQNSYSFASKISMCCLAFILYT
jgi:hypothetical protein